MPRYSEDARTESEASAPRIGLQLERTVHAPARARAIVAHRCEQLGLDGSLSQSLILLVSEAVTNAVRHSLADLGLPIELVVDFGENTIRVAVTDAGNGFTPRPRDPTRDGYGLYLLEKVATRWGVESRGNTEVWFELPRGG